MSLLDLRPWSWTGTVDRLPYLIVGCAATVIKLALDIPLALAFEQEWSPVIYWLPGRWQHHAMTAGVQAAFLVTMLAVSLPFVWIGVGMSLRRLRAIGLAPWLVVFFFVPGLNVLLFLALIVVPSRPPPREPHPGPPPMGISRAAAAARAVGVAVTVAVPAILVAVFLLEDYGFSLFLAVPFAVGMTATLVFEGHYAASLRQSLAVASTALGIAGLCLVVLMIEGLICIVMASPIALALCFLGVSMARLTRPRSDPSSASGSRLGAIALAVPLLMGLEHVADLRPPTHEVVTSVDVDAPPETVWRHVVSFPDLPPPTEFMFRAGIAHPIGATIDGIGPGALRLCRFSTGDFVEPITTWDEPRLLAFSVTENPPPMRERNPFAEIHPPHLHGFMVSERGQFRLVPLPGGRTRLEGTTWYRHGLWPASYWRLWSDALIHRIHARVLRHVKRLAESEEVSP